MISIDSGSEDRFGVVLDSLRVGILSTKSEERSLERICRRFVGVVGSSEERSIEGNSNNPARSPVDGSAI